MKLDKLNIQNYRLFEDLQIDKLAQVNLIAGKNNSGKTALLEAIRIWASEGDEKVVNHIISKRTEYDIKKKFGGYESLFLDINKVSLFSHANFHIGTQGSLYINDLGLLLNKRGKDKIYSYKKIDDETKINIDYFKYNQVNWEISFEKILYLPSNLEFSNLELWENIDLTPKKDQVIEALNLIYPGIKDIGVYKNDFVKVLLHDESEAKPLKQFGDGINRVFSIALALVSAQDNILLIDEFENGLHYTIQEKLWDFIFKLAKKLNVQVIATTHSRDCIEAFSDVLRKGENKDLGQYMRLDRDKTAKVKAVIYEHDVFINAVDKSIETR